MKPLLLALLLFPVAFHTSYSQCGFSVSLSTENVGCFGDSTGKAWVSISGTTGPYSYFFNSNPPQTTDTAFNLPAGNYAVTVTDTTGCVELQLFTITQPVILRADIGFDTTICNQQTVQLQSLVTGGNDPYQYFWSCNQVDCALSDASGATPDVTPALTTNYVFYALDSNGCQSNTDTVTVTVNPLPVVDAGPDVEVYYTESTPLNATANSGGTYSWTPSTGLDNATVSDPTATPGDTTSYVVLFTDGNGCQMTDTVIVLVNFDITIPTGLTPDGDTHNDTWDIKNLVTYPTAKVEVYDRFGDRVFASVGYSSPWDGTYNGKPLPAGPYFYIIDLGVGADPFTGTVTLIR